MLLNLSASAVENDENHGSFISIFMGFFSEFFGLIKYIFYDVWRGVGPV